MKQYELAVGLHDEGNDPAAFKTLYTALETDPGNSRAHHLLATLYLVRRDENPEHHDAEAEKHFEKVLAIEEASERPNLSLIADAYNSLGVLRIHQKRYADAAKAFQAAIDKDLFNPKAYMAWGNLGWARQEQGDHAGALEALARAVKINPQFCVGHYRIGESLMARKAYEDAEVALTQALQAHESCENFQDAWRLRGEARMNLGHREDARQDFERCVELQSASDAGKACRRFLEATY